MSVNPQNDIHDAFAELPYLDDPGPLYGRLRSEAPVLRSPNGFWYVSSYELVNQAIRRPAVFACDKSTALDEGDPYTRDPQNRRYSKVMASIILSQDGDVHRRLRNIVKDVFSRRGIATFRTLVRSAIDAQFDEAVDGVPGRAFDLKERFCLPIPTKIILQIFGVPPAEAHRFYEMSDTIIRPLDAGTPDQWHEHASAVFDRHWQFVVDAAEERRRAPGDDLLTRIATARENGAYLSDIELVAFVSFLITAGYETVANTFANGVHRLLQHPDQLAALRADPSRLPAAVEEILRYEPATRNTAPRFVAQETELGGHTLHRGEMVYLGLQSANRDPAVFADPESFDTTRSPNPHLGFGAGPHACIGMALARLELEEGLSALLARFPTLRAGGEPQWRRSMIIRGLESLPVQW
ncbi:cytochrome P450 [Pseudonocardia alni]|uniref:cytochrome P450 n=1 Tax=Pseudonocardia alni TaxID=33907 RepID=UPI00332C06D1